MPSHSPLAAALAAVVAAAAAAALAPAPLTCSRLPALGRDAALVSNKAKEITRLNGVYVSLLKNAGVTYVEGRGSLVDAHTVKVCVLVR